MFITFYKFYATDKLYPNLQKEFKNICKERKLARKYIVKEIGIADLTIQKWFNGTRVPSETMQDKVCKYCILLFIIY